MRTRKLDPIEIRVLGALMEKERTTPDAYPMTINGVIAACNQKSNREPVMQLTETEVVEALDRLREDVLTWRSDGARVERWQHSLDRRWQLDSAKKAIMCLLLLRGPQTVGELKTRCERQHHFESPQDVESVLRQMAADFDALVAELPRQPGKRENRWTHLVLADEYAAEPEAMAPSPVAVAAAAPPWVEAAEPAGPSAMERLEEVEARLTETQGRVQSLEEELMALRRRLGDVDS